ncbi:hypothetical protein [Amycolatopsis pigmentata]|uniref:Uncharacterized protein n=1 Tax=Amycolatopsis pigmentata TaxID=450801 RepID=A0ABW5G8S1_9PSEU
MSTTGHVKAQRGDLAVIVSQVHDFIIGQPLRTRTEVDVCEVTNITRDGHVKAVIKATWGMRVEIKRWVHRHTIYIVPKNEIDVSAAMKASAENPWPSGHAGMPYRSLGDAREALRPFRRPASGESTA